MKIVDKRNTDNKYEKGDFLEYWNEGDILHRFCILAENDELPFANLTCIGIDDANRGDMFNIDKLKEYDFYRKTNISAEYEEGDVIEYWNENAGPNHGFALIFESSDEKLHCVDLVTSSNGRVGDETLLNTIKKSFANIRKVDAELTIKD